MSARIVIHDACVLIDLAHGRLLADFTRLGWTSATSDLVRLELASEPVLDAWVGRHIEIHETVPERMLEVIRLRRDQPDISPADASAWLLARQLGGPLLTNEKRLRQLASAGGVAVIGVLGLMDRLHEGGITGGPDLCRALDQMLANRARLPASECETRRRRWRG